MSCKSNALRRKAQREDLNLTNLLKAGRALELSEIKAKEVESDKGTVNTIKLKDKKGRGQGKVNKRIAADKSKIKSHAMGHAMNHASPMDRPNVEIVVAHTLTRTPVPRKIKKCKSCGILNYFARVCRTNPPEIVKRVTEDDTDEEEYCERLHA